MKTLLVCCALAATASLVSAAEPKDSRLFEMRIYYAPPGKLDDLHARFRDHTTKLFAQHGMQNIGYWVPVENPENKLIYVLAYPSREAREKSWQAFLADPDWRAAAKASEVNGRLVAKIEQRFMTAADYSPAIKPGQASPERVFELREYTASPGNLAALDARFRDHTIKLFSRHGMEHFGYWHLAPGQKGSDSKLIYILAHKNQAAAAASFDAFRKDADWIKARKESEEKAGGSLTAAGGVTSTFMKPTDYSPSR